MSNDGAGCSLVFAACVVAAAVTTGVGAPDVTGKATGLESIVVQRHMELDIHRRMLQDTARTEAWSLVMMRRPYVLQGTTVLDLTCGIGILSVFAAASGAERVYCVVEPDLAEVAEEVVARNNASSVVQVLQQSFSSLELPAQVDVLFAEWDGPLLVSDKLRDILSVRDRWLKPGGEMWPSVATLWVQPYGDTEWWAENAGYWQRSPYGLDLGPVSKRIAADAEQLGHAPLRGQWRISGLKGEQTVIGEWDLKTVSSAKTLEIHEGSFKSQAHGTVHGLLLWCDLTFTHPSGNVSLSAHPAIGVTSRGQVFWPFVNAPLKDEGELAIEGAVRLTNAPQGGWQLSMKWRAPPAAEQWLEASTGSDVAAQLAVEDHWGAHRSLEDFVRRGGGGDSTKIRRVPHREDISWPWPHKGEL